MQIHRRSAHSMHGRTDHRGKGKFNSQEVEGWRKKAPISDSPGVTSSTQCENSIVHMQNKAPKEFAEKSGSYLQGKDEGESMPPMFDPNDSQAQVITFILYTTGFMLQKFYVTVF